MAVIVPSVTVVALAEAREGPKTMSVGIFRVDGKCPVEIAFRLGPAAKGLADSTVVLQIEAALGVA